jgi:hypothetical protein
MDVLLAACHSKQVIHGWLSSAVHSLLHVTGGRAGASLLLDVYIMRYIIARSAQRMRPVHPNVHACWVMC